MRSTWTKAVVWLGSCGALLACDGRDTASVGTRPQSALPPDRQVQGAMDADPGKYDVLKLAQPADRVVEF